MKNPGQRSSNGLFKDIYEMGSNTFEKGESYPAMVACTSPNPIPWSDVNMIAVSPPAIASLSISSK